MQAWPPGDPRACLRSHGASVGLSTSGAWLCLPNHVRAEWAACFTPEVGAWAHSLLPTPLSPKSRLGLHFPRSPPFLWASAGRRAQAGSQLHWKPGCVGMAGGPYSGGQETWPPRRELQGPSLAAATSSLNKWESLAPGPFLTAALASAAWHLGPGAPPHSAAWAPGGPTCAHITPASLQTQAPAAAARGGPPGLHWV